MINQINLQPTCSFIEPSLQGERFSIRAWGNVSGARGIALLVHGLGARSAWFEAEARELSQRGFFVLAYDQRGFGSRRSIPLKKFTEWINDLSAVVQFIRQTYAGLPVYLMGNSMGALVAMAAAEHVEVEGIVIFSPGFDGHPETFTVWYKFKTILSALLFPNKDVMLPYQIDLVTRDISVRQWLDSDPEKCLSVPGSMLFELLKLSQQVVASLKHVTVPVLMMTAGVERVVNNEVNEKLFDRLSAPSKKHVHMVEAWHDLMFDPLLDEVADEIAKWQNSLQSARSQAAC